ncbi:MAG: hypothetical protein E5W83_10475 [Mesorhizobium sp.]|nr:MAG: hypothetical protein E5W83_10475 [Mesorhizobium sp.]
MLRDMRRRDGNRIVVLPSHYWPDNMPASERTAEGESLDTVFAQERYPLRNVQQPRQQRGTVDAVGVAVQLHKPGQIGRPDVAQARSGREQCGCGHRRFALALVNDPRGRKTKGQVEPVRGSGGAQPQVARTDPRQDIVHDPAASTMRLQAGRGDDHANRGEARSEGKPHGGDQDPPDFVLGHNSLAHFQQQLPVLGPMRPADADRKRMQLFKLNAGDVADLQLERTEPNGFRCLQRRLSGQI